MLFIIVSSALVTHTNSCIIYSAARIQPLHSYRRQQWRWLLQKMQLRCFEFRSDSQINMTCHKRSQMWKFFCKDTSVKSRNKTLISLAELWIDTECLYQEDCLCFLFSLSKIQNHIKQLHHEISIVNDVRHVVNTKRAELGSIFRCLLLLLMSFTYTSVTHSAIFCSTH